MNRRDRIRAFTMRCDGMTWTQIGAALNYDPQTVAKDLHTVLEKRPRTPRIRYPAIRDHVQQRCSGSVEIFAGQLGVSPYRLRRVLVYGDTPSDSLRQKILAATDLAEQDAFYIPFCENRKENAPCSKD